MSDTIFDHENLDVYRLSVEYVSVSFRIARELTGLHRHARDQWLRAAQSIPLNIAEGNGKRRLKDRVVNVAFAQAIANNVNSATQDSWRASPSP